MQTSRANVYHLGGLSVAHLARGISIKYINKMHDEGKARAEFNIRDVHIIQGHYIRPRTKLNHGLNSYYLGNKVSLGVLPFHFVQAASWYIV